MQFQRSVKETVTRNFVGGKFLAYIRETAVLDYVQHRYVDTWSRRAGIDDVDHRAVMTSGPQIRRAAGSRCADAQWKLAAVHRACASADCFGCVTYNMLSFAFCEDLRS